MTRKTERHVMKYIMADESRKEKVYLVCEVIGSNRDDTRLMNL